MKTFLVCAQHSLRVLCVVWIYIYIYMCVVLKIINYFECLLVRIIQLARACACSTKNNNNKIKIIVFICVVVVVVLTNESRGINYAQIRRQTTQRNQPGFITWRSTNKLQNIFGRGGTPSWIEWMTPLVLFVKLELGFQVEIYIYIYILLYKYV